MAIALGVEFLEEATGNMEGNLMGKPRNARPILRNAGIWMEWYDEHRRTVG